MQKLYILVFNFIYKLTGKINEGIRNAIVFLCGLLLTSFYFFWPGSTDGSLGEIMIAGSAVVAVMVLFSIKGPMKRIEINPFTYYPMVLFGIGIILIGQLHKVGDGYVMYALDLIFLFPALYFVWDSRGDHDKLYEMISAGMVLAGIVSCAYCFYLAGKGELVMLVDRVAGYKSNVNYLAMMGVAAVVCSLYLILRLNRRRLALLLPCAGVAVGLLYILISASRTAMLAVIGCIFVFAAFIIKMVRSNGMRKVSAAFLIVLMVLAAVAAVYGGREMKAVNSRAVSAAAVAENNEEQAETAGDEDQAASAAGSGDADTTAGRWDASETGDINNFSSGRINVWSVYLSHTTLLGRPFADIRDVEELKWRPEKRAHNNIIEYLYRCGYIVGGIYVLFYIAVGCIGLKMLFSGRYNRPKDAFTVMMIGTYAIYAMLEISTLPFLRILPCLFFLTIAPVIQKSDDYLENKEQ